MSQNIWLNRMDSLKYKHKQIADLLEGKSIAYVDVPAHFNVGDLLIYKGTEAFFKNHKLNITYRSTTHSTDFKQLKKVDVILFHGGGNFGDLYPAHQKLREIIVTNFKEKHIICLPQTIHFQSKKAMEKSADIFKDHPNFDFFVRDYNSLAIADKFTSTASLMPDMAHSLHPLVTSKEVGISNLTPPRILNLVRVDNEQSERPDRLNKPGFDWINIITRNDYRVSRICQKINNAPFLRKKAFNIWSNLSDEIVYRSINYFSEHTIIYTDRLHGFILSTLLGKEVYLEDNSYGKNVAYYEAWLKSYPYMVLIDDK